MVSADNDTPNLNQIKAQLLEWRQGDLALNVGPFSIVDLPGDNCAELLQPVMDDGIEGVVVVSQTCDIVNYSKARKNVKVSPLIRVEKGSVRAVKTGKFPNLAHIDNVPDEQLVADLSRIMTASKPLLVSWKRVAGFDTAQARDRFAFALERNFGRIAFPDDFVRVLGPFRERILEKYKKDLDASEAARIYNSVEEIRVRADPDWDADEKTLSFLVIIKASANRLATREKITEEIGAQCNALKLPKGYQFSSYPLRVATYGEASAMAYLNSALLDFGHLTVLGDMD